MQDEGFELAKRVVDNHLHLGQNQGKGGHVEKDVILGELGSQSSCCEVNHSEHEQFTEKTDRWNKVGIFLSGICALHCLLTPILLLALPVLGGFFENSWIHILLALGVLPVGLFAFWTGFQHHRKSSILGLGLLGMTFIISAAFVPHEWVEWNEIDVVTILGSLSLIIAHVLNQRACQCDSHRNNL